jgi:hypothetical protein
MHISQLFSNAMMSCTNTKSNLGTGNKLNIVVNWKLSPFCTNKWSTQL